MPRYPNAWFHVDAALAPSHREAVKLVTDSARDSSGFGQILSAAPGRIIQFGVKFYF